ncbi:MAG: TrkA family potassium uptake protein [Thermoproteota archaeon]
MKVLVVGAGKLGSLLAKRLSEIGHEVVVIDVDEAKVQKLVNEADVEAYVRDATDIAFYDEINLASFDAVIATTNRDEVNMFVAVIGREYGVPRIVAKVRDTKIAQILERIGLTEQVIVEPSVIASLILGVVEGKTSAFNLVPIYTGSYQLVAVTVEEGSRAEGMLLEELDYPRQGVKILAVFDGERFRDPGEVIRLEAGHQIIALVRKDVIDSFLETFS